MKHDPATGETVRRCSHGMSIITISLTALTALVALIAISALSSCRSSDNIRETSGSTTEDARAKRGGGGQIDDSDISRRLDSLAAVSDGDYVHLHVGQCFGSCETSVSIFRTSPAKFYLYEGEGYRFDETVREPLLYRLRRPIPEEQASALLQGASRAGILTLVNDTTMEITDVPYIWVRARIGDSLVKVDKAYTGGKRYRAKGSAGEDLAAVLTKAQRILTFPMFDD